MAIKSGLSPSLTIDNFLDFGSGGIEPPTSSMKAIQLAEPKQFRVIDVPGAAGARPGRGRRPRPPRRHLRHRLLAATSARCRSSATRAFPATNSASRWSRSATASTNVKPGDRCCRRAVHQLPEVLRLRPRPHQLLREPPDARRPLRRRAAAAVHRPRPQAAHLDEAHVRATGPGRDARHRLPRRRPRPARSADETVPGHRRRADRPVA